MTPLRIDPALWRGETLEERLSRHFVDIDTTEGFKAFVAAKRRRDPSAEILGWCVSTIVTATLFSACRRIAVDPHRKN